MNLLVFPGGGNPDTPLHRKVYAVITRESQARGYAEVFSHCRWPGHLVEENHVDSPALTLQGAMLVAAEAIRANSKEPYVILGRSFGCLVTLECARQNVWRDRPPEKILLWGPSPYWLAWQMYARDLVENQRLAVRKGLKVDASFFQSLKPVESLIRDVAVPTVIATGTIDPYCSPAYLEYLRAISDNKFLDFRCPVLGAPHEVTDDCGCKVIVLPKNWNSLDRWFRW